MRRWSIGRNNIYFDASIYLEDAPWYVFLLDDLVNQTCGYFPPIPLPKIKFTPKDETEKYTLRDWYGDTQQLFHAFVCAPITEWCYKKTKMELIGLPYFFLKEKFPSEDWEEDSDDCPDRLIAAQKTAKSFKNLMARERKDINKAILNFLADDEVS